MLNWQSMRQPQKWTDRQREKWGNYVTGQAAPVLMSGQGKASNTENFLGGYLRTLETQTWLLKLHYDKDLSNDCEQKDFWASLRWLIACDASRNSRECMQHQRKFRFPTALRAYALHPSSTTTKWARFICVAPGVLGKMAGKGLSSSTAVSGRERHASLTGWNSLRIWTPGWTWERQQTPYYQDFQGALNTGLQKRSVPMEGMIAGGEHSPEKSRAMGSK